ncbi:MAG: hypothetical protein AAGI89_02460 [Pseudomonadota bacterium]
MTNDSQLPDGTGKTLKTPERSAWIPRLGFKVWRCIRGIVPKIVSSSFFWVILASTLYTAIHLANKAHCHQGNSEPKSMDILLGEKIVGFFPIFENNQSCHEGVLSFGTIIFILFILSLYYIVERATRTGTERAVKYIAMLFGITAFVDENRSVSNISNVANHVHTEYVSAKDFEKFKKDKQKEFDDSLANIIRDINQTEEELAAVKQDIPQILGSLEEEIKDWTAIKDGEIRSTIKADNRLFRSSHRLEVDMTIRSLFDQIDKDLESRIDGYVAGNYVNDDAFSNIMHKLEIINSPMNEISATQLEESCIERRKRDRGLLESTNHLINRNAFRRSINECITE